ncbi:hypothetical protein AKJ65_02540 [candidate division MSBL1 archaeon SCGC-AAA259E19]|uniref:Cytoplasmic protein n=1 Tax=candidate division MSBL1 archaeon SCGC-AAA259E19 TaxID=1698264 RepID=A0A133ULM1_9EURY|nr:hypothetical protein AKJ65_02540 [candidate division MSBL1 archaeon SCGC-AAA259E19]
MQTFLPYPSFQKSAEVLDFRRLGKQRSEALIILRAIKIGNDWSNHPATKMWEGYERALKLYHDTVIKEWIKRGYENNMDLFNVKTSVDYPPWLGDERLHDSHKSNLLRKNPDYYSQFNWEVPDDLDYFWPTKEDY